MLSRSSAAISVMWNGNCEEPALITATPFRWEKINYGYEKCAAKYSDTPDKETLNVLDSLKETKEAIELELQRSNVMLGSKNGITVKISSDI